MSGRDSREVKSPYAFVHEGANSTHASPLGFHLAAQSLYLAAAPFAFHYPGFGSARAIGFLPASLCSCRQTRLARPDCTAFQQVQQAAKCQLAILDL
jgi:hypothetical protein